MSRQQLRIDSWFCLVPLTLTVLLMALLGASLGPSPLRAAEPVNFDRQVRSILSENCFHCHGPDAGSRQGNLRLDEREGALTSGAIVPGQSAQSELVHRLRSTDPTEQMPPPDSNRRLTADQIDLVARWIDEGATWSEHWAFVAPRAVAPPPTKFPVSNPIDAFLRASLQAKGWEPAPKADRGRLLRRVTMDLTGLPPTIAEQDAFLAESAEKATTDLAWARVVDRLLASPRYGERMVWDWLDAARYADTNGYQGDPTRAMWYWRDWALSALNDNQPFDEFSLDQLAGDLRPNPTQSQLIATGFHRNHMINGEGGRIAEESRVDYVQDRVETTGTVWLGLTLNCCRCHDHKFDALSQREYYQLAAYFNSIEETGANDARGLANPVLSLASTEQTAELKRLQSVESAASRELAKLEEQSLAELPSWLEQTALAESQTQAAAIPGKWQPLRPSSLSALEGSTLTADDAGIIDVSGPNPDREQFSLLLTPPAGQLTAIRLEALTASGLPNQGPGRAENGNFVLTDFSAEVYGRVLEIERARADFAQVGHPAELVIDNDERSGWAIVPQTGRPHELQVIFKSPATIPATEVLTVRLKFQSPHRQHVLGRFRLSYSSDPPEVLRGLPAEVRTAINKPAAERNEAERKLLSDYFLSTRREVLQARSRVEQAKSRREAYDRNLPRTMVMRERAMPRTTQILVRGAYDKPADEVSHGTPKILPGLPENAPANRLALAEWLVDHRNPLTARVVVNRIWQTFFGVGLVKTVDDFGVQGEKPLHPELLDWLAVEFMDSGWDVKHVHRLIVTSETYQQSSQGTAETFERDPENRWLARGPRLRWPSWMLRDQALAVSGLLEEQLGGPPVKGYQPEGIWEEATFGKIRYQQDHGVALYRRSLYQFWRRIVGPTVFFDVSNRQSCAVSVSRTNTPLQALVLLNDITFMEAARQLAERILREGGDSVDSRLTYAFRLVLARPPVPAEQELLRRRLETLTQYYQQQSAAAEAVLKVGESPRDPHWPAAEVAAWTTVSSLLLNLDEALSKE